MFFVFAFYATLLRYYHALIDKYSIITRSHKVTGTPNNPVYVQQGAIL